MKIWDLALLCLIQLAAISQAKTPDGSDANEELCLKGNLWSLMFTSCDEGNSKNSDYPESLIDGAELIVTNYDSDIGQIRFKLLNPTNSLCLTTQFNSLDGEEEGLLWASCSASVNDNVWRLLYSGTRNHYNVALSAASINKCIGKIQDDTAIGKFHLISGCNTSMRNKQMYLLEVEVEDGVLTRRSFTKMNGMLHRYLKGKKNKKAKANKKKKGKKKKGKKKKKAKKGKTRMEAPSMSPSSIPSAKPTFVATVNPSNSFLNEVSQDPSSSLTTNPSSINSSLPTISVATLVSNAFVISLLFGGVSPSSLSVQKVELLENLLEELVRFMLDKKETGVMLDSVTLINTNYDIVDTQGRMITSISYDNPFLFRFDTHHIESKVRTRKVQSQTQTFTLVTELIMNNSETLSESVNATGLEILETPSDVPTSKPSFAPSQIPLSLLTPSVYSTSKEPSFDPSTHQSSLPTEELSKISFVPSVLPSSHSSTLPTKKPSRNPSLLPSQHPSTLPTKKPSRNPSLLPSQKPSSDPSVLPSPSSSGKVKSSKSLSPSFNPSGNPSSSPSMLSSKEPSFDPSVLPSSHPPSTLPTENPSQNPSINTSGDPSSSPSMLPSKKHSFVPSVLPSSNPSTLPTKKPSQNPSINPSGDPSSSPSLSQEPSDAPTVLISTTVIALVFEGIDPSTMACDESDSLANAMSTFFNNTFDDGMYLLSLTITNDSCSRRLNERSMQETGEPILFEIEAYISSDYEGRFLRRGLGFLYGAITLAIASGSSALINEVQNSNPAFSNVIGVLQIEPPSSMPTASPSGYPSLVPSTVPTFEPTSYPSDIPSISAAPTKTISEVPTSFPTMTSPPTTSFEPTANVDIWMVEMLGIVNDERLKVGSDPLCYNGKLIAAAITHTSDMVQNNFFSHTGSDGSSASNRVFREGYQWSNVGENIAYGQTSVESVMNSWMNSAGHRANILNNSFRHFGVAENSKRWTQVFGNGSTEDCRSYVASMSPSSSRVPSNTPTNVASATPSLLPSLNPSESPTLSRHPSGLPTHGPSSIPSSSPSNQPSKNPSIAPSVMPSFSPSYKPSLTPSDSPSLRPSISHLPSSLPSHFPSDIPTNNPSLRPSTFPSSVPSNIPSLSWMPSSSPSISFMPSLKPSSHPSSVPSISFSPSLSTKPSSFPSRTPSLLPSGSPSLSFVPSSKPSIMPSVYPTGIPTSYPSGSPSESPTLSSIPSVSNAPTSHPISQLERAILEDILPSDTSSSQCSGGSIRSSYSFDFSPPEDDSKWYAEARGYETDVFLAEMRYIDDDDDKSWTIRIGQGGNIYSFVGPFGESVPPQNELGAAYIDDVWQNICVTMKTFENYDYYIYQSGTYQDDYEYLTEKPFFSPSLAKHCITGECSFASWNQQALVPTEWESPVLNFNRYKDCGDGVLEMTSVIYNDIVGDLDTLVYLNLPRAGIRASSLRDILISPKDGTDSKLVEPLQDYLTGQAHLVNQEDTGGYAIFAEDVVSENTNLDFEMPSDSEGNVLSLVMNGNFGDVCTLDEYMTDYFGRYLAVCNIEAVPIEITDGCMNTVGCDLFFRNNETNEGMHIYGVLYWAASSTQIYIFPSGTAEELNTIFHDGSIVSVSHYETGKSRDEQTALGHVFGLEAPHLTQIVAGTFGDLLRDSLAYTVAVYPNLNSGERLLSRQYFVIDELNNIDAKASNLVSESYQEVLPLGYEDGRIVRLFSFDDELSMFSAMVESFSCGHGKVVCSGTTTPQENTRPLYSIKCGDVNYVGSNTYALSPDGNVRRPYVCDGQVGIRPTYSLLGFFEDGACDSLLSSEYLENLCSELTDIPSEIPSITPSDAPSQSPSIEPSISVQPTDTSPLTGLLVPLYLYPIVDSDGNCISQEYINVATNVAAGKTIAIVNPSNGPTYASIEQKIAYESCIAYLRSYNVEVIGYIHTKVGYPSISSYRPMSDIKADISIWFDEYDVDGIFIDEVSNRWTDSWDSEEIARSAYQEIIEFVLTEKSFGRVVLNPGSPYFESIIHPWFGDNRLIAVVFENSQHNFQPIAGCSSLLRDTSQSEFGPGPWCAFIPGWDNIEPLKDLLDNGTILKDQAAALIHTSVKDAVQTGFSIEYAINNNIGWLYVTDKVSWGELADQKVFDAQSKKAMNYDFEFSSNPSSLPSSTPSTIPSGTPSLIPYIGTSLDSALLEDLLPPSSSSCPGSDSTSFTFDYTEKDPLKWVSMSRGYESDVFLAEMEHIDLNANRTWSIRIGSGSNIYSFVGPFGEAVPPQWHSNAPWIDEVWQTVAVNLDRNDPENGESYFIHQAGAYQRDGNYTESNPFFSPNLAKYCKGSECSFASWGQHGHVPTNFESAALYYNRYKDCGDGVIEFTSLVHNSADLPSTDDDYLSYLNVPWGGVRTSVLKDLLISNQEGGSTLIEEIPKWDDVGLVSDVSTTGGYTVWAEDLLSPLPLEPFQNPCASDDDCLDLVIASGGCSESPGHFDSHGIYTIKCALIQTASISTGCRLSIGCDMLFINENTGASVHVLAVMHWAWKGNQSFLHPAVTIAEFNEKFQPGDRIRIETLETGKPADDNLALALVHGATVLDRSWMRSRTRLRYGIGGDIYRSYTAYCVNPNPILTAGNTYYFRQYFIVDQLKVIDERASTLASESYEEMVSIGDIPGRSVSLFSTDSSIFGAIVSSESCGESTLRCTGNTTPLPDHRPLYNIQCGDESYVGSNLYALAPDGNPRRPYVCKNQPDVRASWKLLGYFIDGSCAYLSSARFDGVYCENATQSPSLIPSTHPSDSPSITPSTLPSDSFAPSESTFPTVTPSATPTVTPSAESPSFVPTLTLIPSETPSSCDSTVDRTSCEGFTLETSCLALADFYESTQGCQWNQGSIRSSRRLSYIAGSAWFSGTPTTGGRDAFCDWHGVGCETSCSSGCDVTTLDMFDNNLGGTIPTQVGNLVALESLDLSGNNLGGSIPSEIANCQNLQIFTADGNDFDVGTAVPDELCNIGLSEFSTDCDGDYFVVCSCCTDCGDQVAPSKSPSNIITSTPSVTSETPSLTPSETPSVTPSSSPSAGGTPP